MVMVSQHVFPLSLLTFPNLICHLVTNADKIGEHNIIHEKYKSWEEVSEPTPISQLTRQTSTSIDKKAKMVHIPHDASLAPSGIIEALEVASALRRESDKGMPRPERFFVSSLKRTGETCGLEWGWLLDSSDEAGHSVGIGERGGWVEGGDRGCGIPATVIEVRPLHSTIFTLGLCLSMKQKKRKERELISEFPRISLRRPT